MESKQKKELGTSKDTECRTGKDRASLKTSNSHLSYSCLVDICASHRTDNHLDYPIRVTFSSLQSVLYQQVLFLP